MKRITLFSLAILLFGVASIALALTELTIPITDYIVIAPADHAEEATVLINIPFPDSLIVPDSLHIPDSLKSRYIVRSEIICSIQPFSVNDSIFEVAMIPINIPWDRHNIRWGNNWREGGGNLIDTMLTFGAVVRTSNGRTTLDINDIVLRWADGSYPNYGLAIKSPADMPHRFQMNPIDNNHQELAILKLYIVNLRH